MRLAEHTIFTHKGENTIDDQEGGGRGPLLSLGRRLRGWLEPDLGPIRAVATVTAAPQRPSSSSLPGLPSSLDLVLAAQHKVLRDQFTCPAEALDIGDPLEGCLEEVAEAGLGADLAEGPMHGHRRGSHLGLARDGEQVEAV